jgi:hypothetical protein
MHHLGLLNWLSLGFALGGAGIVVWGLATGRIRPRGYRGAVALAAVLFVSVSVAGSALFDHDSYAVTMAALGVALAWGRFTVPKPASSPSANAG